MKFKRLVTFKAPLFLLLLLASPAWSADTRYVAKTGHDTDNTCAESTSVSTPKLTIAAGLACMSSGDTMIVKAGTYAEAINFNQIVSGGGTWETATVIKAAGETVTLLPTTGGGGGDVVWFYGKSWVIFGGIGEGFVVDGTNVSVQGIRVNNASHHIRIIGNEIKNAPSNNCIGFQDAASGTGQIEVLFNKIHNCGSDNHHHGIYVTGNNNLIEGNEIYNMPWGHGVHVFTQSAYLASDNIVRFNYVHDNGSRGMLIGSGSRNKAHDNIVAHNNLTGDPSVGGGIMIGFNEPIDNEVYNNTVYDNTGYCFRLGSGMNPKFVNNICYGNDTESIFNDGAATGLVNTNNLYGTNPLFVDAANRNFALKVGSPAIDRGTTSGITRAYNGSAPDIGACVGTPEIGTVDASTIVINCEE